MNYYILFALFLWFVMCLVCIKICYNAIKHRETGTSKQWALVVALGLGTLLALKFGADYFVNK